MTKEFSETRPEATVPQQNGTVRFNFNIKEVENGFSYDSVDVAGEFTRNNICHAFLLGHYEQSEIDELLSTLCESDEPIDKLRWDGYNALKAVINGWIDIQLGSDFE